MFRSDPKKAQSIFPKPPPVPARSIPQSHTSARSDRSAADSVATAGASVIGNDLTILGERISIVSQNELHIDGDVVGDVHGRQVVIGKGGSVTGEVFAEKVFVCGEVRGPIRAITVALHGSANVDGDIVSQTLSINQGAVFDGRARRSNTLGELAPVLDIEAIARQPAGGGDAT